MLLFRGAVGVAGVVDVVSVVVDLLGIKYFGHGFGMHRYVQGAFTTPEKKPITRKILNLYEKSGN